MRKIDRRTIGAITRPGLLALVAVSTVACATTGATFRSGVGDELLDQPPYYTGSRVAEGAHRIGHVPIAYQRGAMQANFFDPESAPGSPVSHLLQEMNDYLDSLGASAPLPLRAAPRSAAPDVHFGCEVAALEDCDSDSQDISVQGAPWMRLAVGRPSAAWVASVASALERAGSDRSLVITLEVGQYWTHQKNLRGAKEVRLGTGYSQPLPWLTSLDQPVQVLQLTGALVDADGQVVRIGAEGLVAQQTNLVLSGFGVQALISDEDVQRLRTQRRDDLPGRPLTWHVALENLVRELTGRELSSTPVLLSRAPLD